jgi:hypothetical protein
MSPYILKGNEAAHNRSVGDPSGTNGRIAGSGGARPATSLRKENTRQTSGSSRSPESSAATLFHARAITQRDPEQEVRGIAVHVLDAVLQAVRSTLGDHPVVAQMYDVLSVESIEEGEPIRAVDAYVAWGAPTPVPSPGKSTLLPSCDHLVGTGDAP